MLTANIEQGLLHAYGRDIEISCLVRNELNKWRPRRNEPDVFLTVPHGLPAMPREFPKGKWRIGRPEARTDPYEAPYYIPTDATQKLEKWALQDGYYYKPTGEYDVHKGYGIVYSVSGTTNGSIKVYDINDLLWLVQAIKEDLAKGTVLYLMVE